MAIKSVRLSYDIKDKIVSAIADAKHKEESEAALKHRDACSKALFDNCMKRAAEANKMSHEDLVSMLDAMPAGFVCKRDTFTIVTTTGRRDVRMGQAYRMPEYFGSYSHVVDYSSNVFSPTDEKFQAWLDAEEARQTLWQQHRKEKIMIMDKLSQYTTTNMLKAGWPEITSIVDNIVANLPENKAKLPVVVDHSDVNNRFKLPR